LSATSYDLPENLVDLMENTLSCKTDGCDKSGLRWVKRNDNIACVFFEKITERYLNIYILPSTKDVDWRNENQLKKILREGGNEQVINYIQFILQTQRNELRLKEIGWDSAYRVLPSLVAWAYNSQQKQINSSS